jgi:peroxiredoxin
VHLVEVQKELASIEDVRTVAVMPGTTELLAAVSEHLGLTIPVLSDPDWTLHRRYGMKRGTRREIFLSIATWKAYARLFRSWNLRRPSEDVFQLGGAAIVDRNGQIAWVHRGASPADYADPAQLVAAVEALRDDRP